MNSYNGIHEKRRNSQELSLTQLLKFPAKWKEYKTKFKKVYADLEEEKMRKQIFFQRYKVLEEHNKKVKQKMSPFKVRVTEFSDSSDEEIAHLVATGQERKSLTQFSSDEEEWNRFKERKRKKFKSTSKEDIPKLFFLTKLNEIKNFREYLNTIGLRIDLKEIDKYCDFDTSADVFTVFEETITSGSPNSNEASGSNPTFLKKLYLKGLS